MPTLSDDDRLARFDEWAPPDPAVDFPFWYKLAYSADEPVLEAGCGSGRITIPLGEYGIRAVGLDDSTQAIAQARLRVAATPDLPVAFHHGDIRSAALPHRFGLAIFPANALLRLLTPDDQRAALVNVRRHLRLGGRVALALFVPDLSSLAADSGHQGGAVRFLGQLPPDGEGATTAVYEHRRVLPFEQIIERHLVAETIGPDGQTIARYQRHARMAYLWPREVRQLLELAGFQVEACYGNFRQEAFSPESTQQIWIARKTSEEASSIRSGQAS